MPYYSRYRRRTGYSKYRRRYGYRRLGYRRYRRRTTGGSVTSRSRVRVKVQCEEVVQLTIAANTVNSTVCSSVPLPIMEQGDPPTLAAGATESPLYRAYCGLFDQVKCDGVISKVSVTTPVGSGNSSVPALQIVTAYDRAGTYYEAAQLRQGTNAQGQVVYVNNPMTYPALLASSGSVVRSALNNSVAKLARSCWASDVQERTMFHDCTLQNRGDVPADTNDLAYSQTPHACPFFCPLFYVGFHLPTTAPTQDLRLVSSCLRHTTSRSVTPSLALLVALPVLLLLMMIPLKLRHLMMKALMLFHKLPLMDLLVLLMLLEGWYVLLLLVKRLVLPSVLD